MSTIHMDVESCQAVRSSMINTKDQLGQQAQQLKGSVDNMVGQTFIAPAADQFKGEVEAWYGKMNQLLEELQTLTDRLNREIDEFVNSAQGLSS